MGKTIYKRKWWWQSIEGKIQEKLQTMPHGGINFKRKYILSGRNSNKSKMYPVKGKDLTCWLYIMNRGRYKR